MTSFPAFYPYCSFSCAFHQFSFPAFNPYYCLTGSLQVPLSPVLSYHLRTFISWEILFLTCGWPRLCSGYEFSLWKISQVLESNLGKALRLAVEHTKLWEATISERFSWRIWTVLPCGWRKLLQTQTKPRGVHVLGTPSSWNPTGFWIKGRTVSYSFLLCSY